MNPIGDYLAADTFVGEHGTDGPWLAMMQRLHRVEGMHRMREPHSHRRLDVGVRGVRVAACGNDAMIAQPRDHLKAPLALGG
ncbi:hypothetical protein D3C86_1882510 [compost metagenome]